MPDSNLIAAIAAYIPHDRVERLLQPDLPEPADGVALIADISGFTPLTEALAAGLSADHGAEELTRALDGVFTPLVRAVHAYRGSVLKFGGDALIVWYPRLPGAPRAATIRRAIASALQMQREIARHGTIATPIGPVTLRMKIGMAFGPLRRFTLGLPEFGYEDAPVGRTLDRMAEAEHHAEPGEVLADDATIALIATDARTGERRDGHTVVHGLRRTPRPRPWPVPAWSAIDPQTLLDRLMPYIPAPIGRTLAAGRTQVAELKPVISLFVQFHGLDYDDDPLVGERLQEYFAAAQRVAERYGGRVNRLITGDKGSLLHVIFGAPIAVEEQEQRALRCALDLQRECGGLPFLRMQRIGVAGGRVFAGPVGGPERHDYTTMGDAINLSARLMQNAADGQILAEAEIAARAGATIDLIDLGAIQVKGKAEPIRVCAVHGLRTPSRTIIAAPAIYGRDQELATLRDRLERLAHGEGGIAVLSGELGMGKTLLIESLRTSAPATVQWLGGACLAYGQQLSGYIVVDLLRDLLGLSAGATAEELRRRLRERCAELFGEEQVPATLPYLARFMGLPAGEESRRIEGLAGESLRWRIFELLYELFGRAARHTPLVLALDDIQWSDPTSLELIEHLTPLATSETPVLLLLAMRPDRAAPSWALRERLIEARGARLTTLDLTPFDSPTAAALALQLAPGLPSSFAIQLATHAGGNPLFLVELIRALAARGLLDDSTRLDGTAIETLDLPDNVQGLLLAQIDRLAVEARHTLQVASVIGPSFLERVLAVITAGERDLDRRLAELTGEQFIGPEDERAESYRFRHALVQQSAYSTLLYERRRAYHRAVAEALEQLFPSQAVEQSGILAYHYERADETERAMAYQIQAADSARLLAANAEAEALYRHALELMGRLLQQGAPDDASRRARIFLKLAQVRANTLDFAGAQELYDQAFDLIEQAGTAHREAGEASAARHSIRLGVFEHGPSTLDPGLLEVSDISEIVRDLFEGLVEVDAELNIIPAAARRWQVEDGGQRYRFELRPDLYWSDGTPLTAHDIVFAWRRNLDPKTGAGLAGSLDLIAGAEAFHSGMETDPATVGVRALDDLTLEVTLVTPVSYFLYLLDDPITYPQPRHHVETYGAGAFEPARLIGNGAFRLTRWEQGVEIVLERNPFYEGFAAGNLTQVRLLFLPPDLERYQANQIDLCRIEDRGDTPQRFPDETLLLQYLTTFFLGFACAHPPFDTPALRRAFAQAIDRDALVAQVWSDVQKPAHGGIIPPGMSGHSPEINLRFDPRAARELLAAVGGPGSLPPLRMATPRGAGSLPGYLRTVWERELGVSVELVTDATIDQVSEGMQHGAIQLALIGCDATYPDPDYILRDIFHSASPLNFYGWSNSAFDTLVQRAMQTSEPRERMPLYHQADHLLVADETAAAPLYYYQSYALLRPGFQIAETGKVLRGGAFRLKHIALATLEHPD